MTPRLARARIFARLFGFEFDDTRRRLEFVEPEEGPIVKVFWDKLQNLSGNDTKQSRGALEIIIDECGPKIWGNDRSHLLKGGEYEEYHEDIYYSEHRQRIWDICIEMVFGQTEGRLARNPDLRPSHQPQRKESKSIIAKKAEYIADRLTEQQRKLRNLAHVHFWLCSNEPSLYASICPAEYNTVDTLFSAIRAAMIEPEDHEMSQLFVHKINVKCPPQSGIEKAFDIYVKNSGCPLRSLRILLSNAVENVYSRKAKDKIFCEVDVEFWSKED